MSNAQIEKLATDVQQLIDVDDTDQALDLIDEGLEGFPDNPKLLYLKGCLHHQRQELPDAFEALESCSNMVGDLRASSFYMLGNAHRDADDFASACDCYNRALELNPELTDAWINLGTILDDAGQHKIALECYDAALAIDVRDAVAWCNRGNTLRELELYTEALVSYAQAAELAPDCFEAKLGLAACRVRLETPTALDELRRLADESQNPLAQFELASALSYCKQFEESLTLFDRLIEQGANEPALWNNRAECQARLGRMEEAVQSFDRALEVDPFFETAYLGKARALEADHRKADARVVVGELLRFCSEDLGKSATLRELQDRLGM